MRADRPVKVPSDHRIEVDAIVNAANERMLTLDSIRGPWPAVCGSAVPDEDTLLAILEAYRPVFDALFNTEGVFTAHAAIVSDIDRHYPFDRHDAGLAAARLGVDLRNTDARRLEAAEAEFATFLQELARAEGVAVQARSLVRTQPVRFHDGVVRVIEDVARSGPSGAAHDFWRSP